MPNKKKQKGNRVERVIVQYLEERGIKAERARGSDGRAFGEAEVVDVKAEFPFGKFLIQVKGRAKVADYLVPPVGSDCTIVKGDRQEPLIVLRLQDFLTLTAQTETTVQEP